MSSDNGDVVILVGLDVNPPRRGIDIEIGGARFVVECFHYFVAHFGGGLFDDIQFHFSYYL